MTVLARDRVKVDVQHERLRVVDGDVKDLAALADAMRGQDAVISAIGRGKSFKSENLIAESVPGIIAAMRANGVTRLIFTSALGVGDTYRDSPLAAEDFLPHAAARHLRRQADRRPDDPQQRARLDDRAAGGSSPTGR